MLDAPVSLSSARDGNNSLPLARSATGDHALLSARSQLRAGLVRGVPGQRPDQHPIEHGVAAEIGPTN